MQILDHRPRLKRGCQRIAISSLEIQINFWNYYATLQMWISLILVTNEVCNESMYNTFAINLNFLQFPEMYQPRKNNLIFSFFSWYIQFIIKKDFSAFKYSEVEIKQDAAILVLANHFSWWDGFFLFYINKKVFKKQFHVLVNAENYTKVGFLKYLGAFAAENKGKDVLETLNYAGKLLDNPANLVLVFPQGKLYSNHLKNISFEKGVMQMINASQKKNNIIFAATFIDYFSKRKPSAYTYLQHWENEEYVSLQLLKSAYNKHYDQSIVKQTQLIE